jgi:hypothetical protein
LYLRCPYAFFQIDAGYIAPEVMVDELGERLIEEGIEFEQSVTSTGVPLPAGVDFQQALTGDVPFHGLPVLRNEKRHIIGRPDGIDPAAGALVPIEIKSHKDVKRTDLWELAFYWMLLEPYRSRDQRDAEPRGRGAAGPPDPQTRRAARRGARGSGAGALLQDSSDAVVDPVGQVLRSQASCLQLPRLLGTAARPDR